VLTEPVEHLRRFHCFYGDKLEIECPTGSGIMTTLDEIADELCRRLTGTLHPNADGRRFVFKEHEKFHGDSNFTDYIIVYEYLRDHNGRSYDASHQTGWTGLVADLIAQLAEQRREGDHRARPTQDEAGVLLSRPHLA